MFFKSLKLSLYYTVKQSKTDLQKYFHPSSWNNLIYAQVQCREPKKGQLRVQIFKTTTVFCWSVLFISLKGDKITSIGKRSFEIFY